jgi:hypothetical protein
MSTNRRIAGHGLAMFRRTCACLLFALGVAAPAAADDFLLDTPDGLLAFQTDQQRQSYLQWVRAGGRAAWSYLADDLMKPCGRGDDEKCQQNMVALRDAYPDALKNARLVLDGVKFRFLLALRNGNFLYQIAPSYQLLQAIVGTPGNCASWAATANQRLNMPSGGALSLLSNEADAEIPRNGRYPEREVLDGRQGRPGLLETARSCPTL